MIDSRTERIRRTVRVCIERGLISLESKRGGCKHCRTGVMSNLARHFGVSRQRITQVVKEEREAWTR